MNCNILDEKATIDLRFPSTRGNNDERKRNQLENELLFLDYSQYIPRIIIAGGEWIFMSRRRIFFVLHKSFANANEVEIKKSFSPFFGEHF